MLPIDSRPALALIHGLARSVATHGSWHAWTYRAISRDVIFRARPFHGGHVGVLQFTQYSIRGGWTRYCFT